MDYIEDNQMDLSQFETERTNKNRYYNRTTVRNLKKCCATINFHTKYVIPLIEVKK
jgi:hypothetical protein